MWGVRQALRSWPSSRSWVLHKRRKNLPPPTLGIEGHWLQGSLHINELPRAFSVEWDSGTNWLHGAIAWKRIKMFWRHLVNMKCCTNGNNNVKFYLTSSLRTQSGAGSLLGDNRLMTWVCRLGLQDTAPTLGFCLQWEKVQNSKPTPGPVCTPQPSYQKSTLGAHGYASNATQISL